jgi:RNA polymerase sigma-70 factor, ECF subfamily
VIKLHEKRVWSLARQMTGNAEDAREIAQEVFLRVFRHLSGYDSSRPFESWLYRIAMNCTWDFLARRPAHASLDATVGVDRLPGMADTRPGPELTLADREVREVLNSLLGLLTPQERAVFLLRDVQGMETREIAFVLRCSSITVRRHSAAARIKIRQALAERHPEWLPKEPK